MSKKEITLIKPSRKRLQTAGASPRRTPKFRILSLKSMKVNRPPRQEVQLEDAPHEEVMIETAPLKEATIETTLAEEALNHE